MHLVGPRIWRKSELLKPSLTPAHWVRSAPVAEFGALQHGRSEQVVLFVAEEPTGASGPVVAGRTVAVH